MNIWIICSNRWNSAITEYTLRAGQALELRGHQVLISGLAGKALLERSQALGLKVDPWPSFHPSPKNIIKLRQTAQAISCDAVICFGGAETSLVRLLPSRIKKLRLRGQDEDMQREKAGWFFRQAHSHLASVIAPSMTLKRKLEAQLNLPIHAVKLGLDSDQWHYQERDRSETRRPKLAIIGRLDPIKGHGPFFLWFKELQRRWPRDLKSPILEIIGEPANISSANLKAFAADVGLIEGEDFVLIDRRLESLPKHMATIDLGVICSQGSEVICRVAEEFLLSGCPIFVSGVGSLEDCLIEEDFGQSYQKLKPQEAIDAMCALLLKSYKEPEEERQARAQKAKEHFSLQSMAENLETIIKGL